MNFTWNRCTPSHSDTFLTTQTTPALKQPAEECVSRLLVELANDQMVMSNLFQRYRLCITSQADNAVGWEFHKSGRNGLFRKYNILDQLCDTTGQYIQDAWGLLHAASENNIAKTSQLRYLSATIHHLQPI